nr:MAG TPA: hypothetical protein [Caudoviricetes sp.]
MTSTRRNAGCFFHIKLPLSAGLKMQNRHNAE